MTDGETARMMMALGCLVLVGSSLVARRLPFAQSAKMALAWVAIFGVGFMLYALRGDFGGLWQRVAIAGTGQSESGGTMRIARGEDGHFAVNALVNGVPVRFLVDTGATVTSMTVAAARAAKIETGGFPVVVETANGMAEGARGTMDTLEIGSIQRSDLSVHVMPGMGDTNLLGMNFLSSLRSWRVEGSMLVLES